VTLRRCNLTWSGHVPFASSTALPSSHVQLAFCFHPSASRLLREATSGTTFVERTHVLGSNRSTSAVTATAVETMSAAPPASKARYMRPSAATSVGVGAQW
jgi:hypothetical protein